MDDEVQVTGGWRAPRWITALLLLYLILGSAGGIWFGIDRVFEW